MAQSGQTPPHLFSTLRNDFTQGGFLTQLKREAREIEEFYLSDEDREQLKRKGKFSRWFVLGWWVLKYSILKLTSFRRILLIVGLVLVFVDVSYQGRNSSVTMHYNGIGVICLLLVIILELKDKLLARVELESGRAVQRAMIPESTPSIPGWNAWLYTRPANEVGGDLVDFIKLNGSRSGIAIGDVAGKGLGAALFMVKIQATLRALAPDFESPSDLVAKLNSILIRDGIPSKFASLVFARIDSLAGSLQLVNAGHMPPLVVSAEEVTELPKGGPALGLSVESQFMTQDIRLENKQTLVIYSDGLTEAQNESEEFYGLERVKALCRQCASFPPQAFGERILLALSAFEGEARRRDDLSLVILQKSS